MNPRRAFAPRAMRPVASWTLLAALAGHAHTAIADHGADPARELPIWALIGVAVVVGLVFAITRAVKMRSRREDKD
jgi:hypothetical protein